MIRHGFFDQYAAPDSDTSLYKNIPISLRDHAFVKGMLAVGCRVVYRGPRTNRGTHTTLKRDANAFSIYPPSPRWDHAEMKAVWPWESVRSNAVYAQHGSFVEQWQRESFERLHRNVVEVTSWTGKAIIRGEGPHRDSSVTIP